MGEQEQAGEGGSVIRFGCKSCGQKIRVPQSLAGKKGRCPKCKGIVIIPTSQDFAQVSNRDNPDNLKTSSNKSGLDPSLFDIPQTDTSNQSPAKDDVFDEGLQAMAGYQIAGRQDKAEQTGERKFPWLIDIFLYPANAQGMIFLAIAVLVPRLIQLASLFLCIFGLILSLFNAVIGMYIYWFLAQCVRDSAVGNLRAPETLTETPGIWELLWQLFEILAGLIVCAAPAAAYFGYTRRIDLTFWILAGFGTFLYPMTLLGVLMFDSISGLNPLIIIPSIFSTFFQYCGLVVLIAAILFLLVQTIKIFPTGLAGLVFYPLLQAAELYLAMIAAHLLGRFYFRYREKLNWEV